MKRDFFDYMHTVMDTNPDVYFLMAGLGYPRVDEFLEKYPDRAFNTEASEMATMQIAVGLAYANKVPIVYSITPFLAYRAFEVLRTYANHEQLHILLIGAGRDGDYSDHGDGFSHDAKDVKKIIGTLKHIKQYYPDSKKDVEDNLNEMVQSDNPSLMVIRR